jgi:peroxiredoxin
MARLFGMSIRRRAVAARFMAMLTCVVFTQCSQSPRDSLNAGERVPDFSLEDLAGHRVALKDLRNKGVVLVNFWATWCVPCKTEIPLLDQIYNKLQDKGFTVVGVSVQERKDTVAAFCRKNPVRYPVVVDPDGAVAKQYGVFAFPTTVVVNREGIVLLQEIKKLDQETLSKIESMVEENRTARQTIVDQLLPAAGERDQGHLQAFAHSARLWQPLAQ